jgi:recombination protein RecR
MTLPAPLERLIGEMSRLPGIGRKGAERLVLHLATQPADRLLALEEALAAVREQIGTCPTCGYFSVAGECSLCCDKRQSDTILVVEGVLDVVAFERGGSYRGLYHVLGGHLSPLRGITPDDLRIAELIDRLADGTVREVIMATSPSVEGEATALYLSRELERPGLVITRLGRGLPMGGALHHTDAATLRLAVEARRKIDAQ